MKHNQNGSINVLLIPLIVAVLILVGAVAFGSWAYSSRANYKNNTEQQIAAAVSAAKQQTTTQLNNQFAVQQESPYDTYSGPEADGSLILKYPKTWSAYVDDTGASGSNINGYFYPGVIPSLNSTTSVFSLRVEVINTPYSQTVQQFTGAVAGGEVTVAPYELPLLPTVVGAEVTGKLPGGQSGTMVVLPIRSQTLEVWTESSQYLNVFNQVILPNLTFSP
jgi:hypothetical protein